MKTHVSQDALVHQDPWSRLRQFTDARIGLGRVGTSIPTSELLKFQLSHAQAMDAVHVPLDIDDLLAQFSATAALSDYLPALTLHSQAQDRMQYLQRPDYGRRLDEASVYQLQHLATAPNGEAYDLAIAVVDGLSSYAIRNHSCHFLNALMTLIHADETGPWNVAPLCIVQQGRVAVGDDVGEALRAREVLVLIGERPGLSSPDSMGLYLSWHPQRGMEDSKRNCISNVRPQGLGYQQAAQKCFYLLRESRRLKLTGVGLKDRSSDDQIAHTNKQTFCLTQ